MSHASESKSPGADIAVIGMACRFPHAPDLNGFWRLISSGEVAFEDIQDRRWTHSSFYEPKDLRAPDKTYVRKGAFIDRVDEFAALHFGLAPRRVQVMDPQQRLAIEVTREALEDAGYDNRPYDRAGTGVFIGASVSEYKDVMGARHRAQSMIDGDFGDGLSPEEAAVLKAAVADVVPIRAFSIAGSLLNMIPCSVAQTFDLNGPAMQIDAACSSALVAIHEAAVNLRAGQCTMAIAGGVYLNLHPDNLVGFSRIGAISPSGICRPFDGRADGFVMGEGIGLVVLKRHAEALRDGDRIYAVLRGSGCNNDGRGEGPMTPRPEGQRAVMARAHAEVDPREFPIDSIGYVEAHGTATTVGDAVEVGALKEFFFEHAGHRLPRECFIGSIKANIGHTMSAAGVAGFIKTCLMLHHRVIPPQPSCEQLNPSLNLEQSPFRIASQAQPWLRSARFPRRAAVSSFGFGGTNAHALLEECPSPGQPAPEREELFLFSAPNSALLSKWCGQLADEVERSQLEPADVALTVAARAPHPARLAVVAKGRRALIAQLRSCAAALLQGAPLPPGCQFQSQPLPADGRKLAFLFPGQGAQRVGLLKDLVERFPSLRGSLERADAAVRNDVGSLLAALYPEAPYEPAAAQARLTRTEVCQPAMAALGLGLGAFFAELGITPDVVLGHSLGEFAAASVAGMIEATEVVRLVARRGQLMNGLALPDPGAMLAVMASRAAVEQALSEPPLLGAPTGFPAPEHAEVWLANDNHPSQVVLSGTHPGIARAQERLAARGLKTARLDVSHAFHSPLMAGVDAGMRELLAGTPVKEPRALVVSCISGQPYSSAGEAIDIWARHASSQVRFVEALRAAHQSGARTFVQMGAGSSLLSFARGAFASPEAIFLSLTPAEGEDGGAQFLATLGALWVRGWSVNARPLFHGRRLVTLPPTPLETQRYWAVERTQRRAHTPLVNVTPSPTPTTPRGTHAMDQLIALFQQQTALLQSQAEILKAQSAALQSLARGDPLASDAALRLLATAAPAPSVVVPEDAKRPASLVGTERASAPEPVAPAPAAQPTPDLAALKQQASERVLASVSRISAFPVSTLKLEQTLVGELGFDSLMLVELDQDVGKAFPQLGGLPRELFSRTTTLSHIVEHLVSALSEGPRGAGLGAQAHAESQVQAANVPLERYVPALTAAPLRSLSESVLRFSGPVLVTRDRHGLAEALAAKLNAEGVTTVVDEVSASGAYAGVIHVAESADDYRAPARTALSLAQRLSADRAELFVTLTTLGGLGRSGWEGRDRAQTTTAPFLGQVSALGFTKALAQEWQEALVKAIDVDLSMGVDTLAAQVVRELASGDRTSEVALTPAGRQVVALIPAPHRPGGAQAAASLPENPVVLVTGGAKGLGLKFARAIAKAHGGVVVLAGRSAPTEEIARAAASVKAAGARACTYQVMDVRDAASVKAVVDAVRAAHGKIDGVVHAAGILADGLIAKKTAAHLDAVLETKAGGALALMEATANDSLSVVVLVGSWAGRFGNAGQTDYSAANEVLTRLGALRPTVRTVTIDFPPWEDSEMAKKIPGFRKAELKASGVTFLSDEEGLKAFLAEVGSGEGEILLGRGVPERVIAHRGHFPVSRLNHLYLNDHTMAGQRVLPFAAALDHLAGAALEARVGEAAPLVVTDFRLRRPVLVPDTIWLESEVQQQIRGGTSGALTVALRQESALAYDGAVSSGGDHLVPTPRVISPTSPPLALSDFYERFTFHGPRLRGITRIDGISADGIVGWVKGCRPADWVKEPLRTEWTIDPLVVDASFQLAGYWAWVRHERAGFPNAFRTLVLRRPFGSEPLRCTVTFEESQGDTYRGTLVWQDAAGEVVGWMTGAEAEFKKRDPQFIARPSAPARPSSHPSGARVESASESERPRALAAAAPESGAERPPEVAEASASLDESTWNPAKFPEYEELQERLHMAEAFGLKNPYFSVHQSICGDTTVVDGKEMINFSSYNYVGNSGDPVVTKAAQDAAAKYGTSVSASRVASGEKPLTRELERQLAGFFGTEDCVVMVSGHATNVTVIGHLVGPKDLILHDALAHDSIIQGAKLSGAKRRPFPHNDFVALDRMLGSLRPHYRRVLICIEGTYSMDGDIPDLPQFIEVKKRHRALLLVDEAHSAGVVGPTGRGIGEYFGVTRSDVDLWMGTLSKSFASCGGYICGSHALVEYLKYTTPGFVYSVGISPTNAAAALAATEQLRAHPERVTQAQHNARLFIKLLRERGINTGMSKDTAVVPAIVGNSVLCLQLSDALKNRGINVQPIIYPAVEEDQARLRFFLSSLHREAQLTHAADLVKEELDRLTRELSGDAVA